MNASHLRTLPLVCAVALGVGVGTVRAAIPVVGAQLFQDTNARIDDLFQIRVNPPKGPGPGDNPFKINDGTTSLPPTASDPTKPTPINPVPRETPDQTLLRQAYANLTFGGLLMVDGKPMIVINKAYFKEGGLLTVRLANGTEYLRIVSLTTDSITLGLREARLTLNF